MTPSKFIPSIAWLRQYPREWLRPDLTAGLTAAAVVVPKAMAYATIAGLPLQVGLYTAIVPMVAYALLGTSRPLSVSTTTTLAILVAAELGRAVPGGDSGALIVARATLSGRLRNCQPTNTKKAIQNATRKIGAEWLASTLIGLAADRLFGA